MSTSYLSNLSDAAWECLQRHLLHPAHRLPLALSPSNFSTRQTVFYHFRHLHFKDTWFRLLTTFR